jgi:hypothetical protein
MHVMTRKYYTLCIWDAEQACWFDEFGSYSRREVAEEKTIATQDNEVRPHHARIIASDESAESMIAARDALPAPK